MVRSEVFAPTGGIWIRLRTVFEFGCDGLFRSFCAYGWHLNSPTDGIKFVISRVKQNLGKLAVVLFNTNSPMHKLVKKVMKKHCFWEICLIMNIKFVEHEIFMIFVKKRWNRSIISTKMQYCRYQLILTRMLKSFKNV